MSLPNSGGVSLNSMKKEENITLDHRGVPSKHPTGKQESSLIYYTLLMTTLIVNRLGLSIEKSNWEDKILAKTLNLKIILDGNIE